MSYIVTKLTVEDNTVEVVDTFEDETKAIECLHKESLQYAEHENKTFDVLVIDDHRLEIVERHQGWIINSKTLKYVYQIINFEKV